MVSGGAVGITGPARPVTIVSATAGTGMWIAHETALATCSGRRMFGAGVVSTAMIADLGTGAGPGTLDTEVTSTSSLFSRLLFETQVPCCSDIFLTLSLHMGCIIHQCSRALSMGMRPLAYQIQTTLGSVSGGNWMVSADNLHLDVKMILKVKKE